MNFLCNTISSLQGSGSDRSNPRPGMGDCFVEISTLPRLNPPRNDGGALFNELPEFKIGLGGFT